LRARWRLAARRQTGDFVSCTAYPDCDYIGIRVPSVASQVPQVLGTMEEVEGKVTDASRSELIETAARG